MDKQIEEMANYIRRKTTYARPTELAEELYKRAIPEGAVVLTREEKDATERSYKDGYEKGCKETAEKFAKQVDKWKRKAIYYYGLAKEGCSFCVGDDDEIKKEIVEGV